MRFARYSNNVRQGPKTSKKAIKEVEKMYFANNHAHPGENCSHHDEEQAPANFDLTKNYVYNEDRRKNELLQINENDYKNH